jgi:hypothetical protein
VGRWVGIAGLSHYTFCLKCLRNIYVININAVNNSTGN